MVFNSLTFVLFFAVVWGLYQLPFPWTGKKVFLLAASYLFYAAWNPPFVLLLMLSAAADFALARWLARAQSLSLRRAILTLSLTLNLGLLAYFKYGHFILDTFVTTLAAAGVHYHPAAPDIILPLGISFYTFETVSYLVDVYRRRIEPWGSFLDYALFLTFFPHLVAGPIVRAGDFLPQCREPRRASAAQLGWGLTLVVVGLFEKVILADALLAPEVDKVFAAVAGSSFVDAWAAALAFAGQIFFDFAGYSTCGIGIALCLGFVLKENFRFPYAAIGFSDFWQRWHISLSTWLRDYLYIPLGGNRRGGGRTYANLMLTMLLGGLWHGAAWRFVAWGGLHGSYLVAERAFRRAVGDRPWAGRWPARVAACLLTFALTCVAWVFFRATDFASAFHLLRTMAAPSRHYTVLTTVSVLTIVVVTAGMLATHWLLRDIGLEGLARRTPWWVRGAALGVLIVSIILAPGDNRAFIYFQF
jgi:alginate O-acetyltransferase complex protein AlgI